MEPAPDETPAERLQKRPVTFDDDGFVKNHRDLFARRPHPIAQHRDGEDCRRDENDALAPFIYGWPQCGHTALPSRRFFWQCGHGTRLPFGRVTRWTINPITQVAGIQPRIVTS